MEYDSTEDTWKHIHRVGYYLHIIMDELSRRILFHDDSKLQPPEKEIFDKYTPLLSGCVYGDKNYKRYLSEMKPALDHHNANNCHHPEHFENGIQGMNLIDLIEMICDWKAAGERHKDGGNIVRSIELNQKRFGYSDELKNILINTAKALEE